MPYRIIKDDDMIASEESIDVVDGILIGYMAEDGIIERKRISVVFAAGQWDSAYWEEPY